MNEKSIYAVTGAFGYTGKYITRSLIENGKKVRVLTGHPERPNPFGDQVEVVPFHFDDPRKLVSDLGGVKTLINTYWVRFSYGENTFGQAVANAQNLIRAAAEAGIERFIHISVSNPEVNSPFSYFKGKAVMEQTLIRSGLSYAIIRPTFIFGKEDLLINNIAWLLRKFPLYLVFGDGEYRVQPVYVGDVARLAVKMAERQEDVICDAAGPETYSFRKFVRFINEQIGGRAKVINAHPKLAYLVSKLTNVLLRDIVVTYEEIYGLMANTLVIYGQPTGHTRFSQWLQRHAHELGTGYSSELNRHFKKSHAAEPIPAFGSKLRVPEVVNKAVSYKQCG